MNDRFGVSVEEAAYEAMKDYNTPRAMTERDWRYANYKLGQKVRWLDGTTRMEGHICGGTIIDACGDSDYVVMRLDRTKGGTEVRLFHVAEITLFHEWEEPPIIHEQPVKADAQSHIDDIPF